MATASELSIQTNASAMGKTTFREGVGARGASRGCENGVGLPLGHGRGPANGAA